MTLHHCAFVDLDGFTLYSLLRLRAAVFVLEQGAPYLDLDGRDLEPATRHAWWDDDDGVPLAYLRLLDEADGSMRIGRVVTASHARRRGLAERLVHHAIASAGTRTIVLDAQAYLQGWYERFGFVVAGAEYVDEDGIAHVPMRRQPG